MSKRSSMRSNITGCSFGIGVLERSKVSILVLNLLVRASRRACGGWAGGRCFMEREDLA